ncbi:phenylacetate-CoA oxygenase, PaaI subunit [Halogeometricum borinquense DSM 11551]|uniref:Phenylacetate-CoA oxygenase, PaaI subunit n=1 Tax=Halogeometricum borinquense (strain ATCC 700274 / DSM 11551 / JCM 10706 / KCTC 4070 / PR3) TaxID=469382 RepID=E4NWB6_HALBP|nr:1,2-phenylacetyl-CoA epoxidase subunit PaaC [Halogeometricum borinquense]ADQ69336.1 phenylacetate-CoA oxygenase, PaaI subunit [Halogeometricum borinquense DSM 11551]ELY26227.1 phenylacetate-CoA oxygenase, PaaI subunit [Halogeometricum borinquense DSM 11551]
MSVESLSGPADLTDKEQEAIELLLRRMADDEFVLAERYTEWQVRAPTIESDISIANIAQDELGHARLWYDLLEDFGYTEPDLLWERDPETFRHSTLVELPFEEGDWADCIVRSYFYDEAEHLRMTALEKSSYPRIRDRVEKVLGEEGYHREHSMNWLRRLVSSDEGRRRVQAATDRLFPYALTFFEPAADAPEAEAAIDELGVRTRTLADMREEWLETVTETMTEIGIDLRTPEIDDEGNVSADALPEHLGRDGDHTDHWQVLFDDFTEAYREMGLHEATRLMKDPDDE